ncbi:MAG: FGGY family carbohydrate kinase [Tabrizicola sp.]
MDGAAVAVLDVGKSNVKLSACTAAGHVVETLSTPNPVRPGPPWAYHDLDALNPWVMQGLAALCRRHPLTDVVATGHGSGGMLVADDPDAGGTGLVLPMVDYEQHLPPGLDEAYAPLAGSFFDRGSAVMMAATHTARQMFWAETADPEGFARARWCLGIPQYWAWRLTGVAVSEASILGAQSHLWNVHDRCWSPIVAARGWGRLMPPFARAADVLGTVRPEVQARHGLPPLRVRAGGHDSSVSFHRYQAAGRDDVLGLSTGTWIVAMATGIDPARLDEARGMTLNADMEGRPLSGALTMGGREYSAVAGDQPSEAHADPACLARLVAQGSMALPAFGTNDGQFPGHAGQGRLVGPAPENAEERHALAVLYAALLACACAGTLAPDRPWVLSGSFLRDPAFAGLVAALRPGRATLADPEPYGIAAGAALLCREDEARVPLSLTPVTPLALPGLAPYAARWRALTGDTA